MKDFTKYADGTIESFEELLEQLESLKDEAKIMMPQDEIFRRDFHALKIAIRYIKDTLGIE